VDDHNNLLRALKEGILSGKCADDEIVDLKATPVFHRRHDRYLRKEIRPVNVIQSMLDDWCDKFKCSATDSSSRHARGRHDPVTGKTLFSPETKEVIKQCKEKATYLRLKNVLRARCTLWGAAPLGHYVGYQKSTVQGNSTKACTIAPKWVQTVLQIICTTLATIVPRLHPFHLSSFFN